MTTMTQVKIRSMTLAQIKKSTLRIPVSGILSKTGLLTQGSFCVRTAERDPNHIEDPDNPTRVPATLDSVMRTPVTGQPLTKGEPEEAERDVGYPVTWFSDSQGRRILRVNSIFLRTCERFAACRLTWLRSVCGDILCGRDSKGQNIAVIMRVATQDE